MSQTHMAREVAEIPEAAARFLAQSRDAVGEAAHALRRLDPNLIVTVARGSSDHAATYIKYAVELLAGIPVASVGPSIASIYHRPLKLGQAACLGISQSGRSPDGVEMMRSATAGGALTVAITNMPDSPMAQASSHCLPLQAGEEKSVAATKTFVCSVLAGLSLLAECRQDPALQAAVAALPEALAKAVSLDWSPLADRMTDARSGYVLGRGPGFAIAAEAALKFKETSGLHAEAYSAAEVLHGPVALVERTFPVLGLAARDKAESSVAAILNDLAGKGARAFVTSSHASKAAPLPFVETGHPLTDALALVLPFYGFVEAFSRARGLNPDQPVALKKVTETR